MEDLLGKQLRADIKENQVRLGFVSGGKCLNLG